jgi:hypothetical protein
MYSLIHLAHVSQPLHLYFALYHFCEEFHLILVFIFTSSVRLMFVRVVVVVATHF